MIYHTVQTVPSGVRYTVRGKSGDALIFCRAVVAPIGAKQELQIIAKTTATALSLRQNLERRVALVLARPEFLDIPSASKKMPPVAAVPGGGGQHGPSNLDKCASAFEQIQCLVAC